MTILTRFVSIALSTSCMMAGSMVSAALLNSYDFDSGFDDTLGAGVDLTANGGSVSGGTYNFTDNQGLRLTSALPSITDYGIEFKFRIDGSTSGYNKLIDFQDLTSDFGLYVFDGSLDFFTVAGGGGSITAGEDVVVGLERKAGLLKGFVDGTEVFSGTDPGLQAVPGSNILNFFEDDTATGKFESFAGSVDWIRIHDSAATFGTVPVVIPLPAAAPLLLARLRRTSGVGILG